MVFRQQTSGVLNVVLAGLLFVACILFFLYAGSSTAQYTSEQPLPLEGNLPERRILFIGNSYTFFNSMPVMLQNMLNTRSGRRFNYHADMIVKNAATMASHASDPAALSQLQTNSYDYVFLQEQSTVPFFTDQAPVSDTAFGVLIRVAKERGARVAVFSTWARKAGDDFYSEKHYSNFTPPRDVADMTRVLNDFYKRVVVRYGAGYIPLGTYWLQILMSHPEIEMYIADGSHPSRAGSYLMALAAYRYIEGSVPDDVWCPTDINDSERNALSGIF